MKVEGKLSILGNEDGVTIEVEDALSGELLASTRVTPEVFCAAALGRLVYNRCDVETGELDKIGKKMINKKFEFVLPGASSYRDKELAIELVDSAVPEGWEADHYFDSQDSFFEKGGQKYARCTIRKWVDESQTEE